MAPKSPRAMPGTRCNSSRCKWWPGRNRTIDTRIVSFRLDGPGTSGRAATLRPACGAWRHTLHSVRDTVISAQGRREVLQGRQQGWHPSGARAPAGATACSAQRGQTTVGHECPRLGIASPQGKIVQSLERQCQRKLATDLHFQGRRRGIRRLPGLPLRFP